MFGHPDNQASPQDGQASSSDSSQSDSNQYYDPATSAPSGGLLPEPPSSQSSSSNPAWQHPAAPSLGTGSPEPPRRDVISPAGGFPKSLDVSKDSVSDPMPAMNIHTRATLGSDDNQLTDATDEELIEVKEKALDQLFPLIDKLDQTPEEHFKTLMMIIQASDNQALIQKAYQVAQTIDDEKGRAQALLDIVNEINYFTQQPEV
jgi:hypothetical protein